MIVVMYYIYQEADKMKINKNKNCFTSVSALKDICQKMKLTQEQLALLRGNVCFIRIIKREITIY